ncbi:nitrogenase component 1 [Gorillibacterium massiliense]|uniref:nitrogenase component 1 n=1 Tax=Gorillibacterium massiliense TaxID=1280390 RepID=UPI0004B94EDE|nr:nitrogenase component 1 [Gorillibacterium massiliense]
MQTGDERAVRHLSARAYGVNQAVGGILAMQGVYQSASAIHGSQGCVESIQAVLSGHYREPVTIHNIAIHEYNLISGGGKSIHEALRLILSRHNPDVVAVIGTTLTESVGEDLEQTVQSFQEENRAYLRDKMLIAVHLPDCEGSLEAGYGKMVYSVVKEVIHQSSGVIRKKRKDRINLLPGAHLSPGDVMELKEIIASFGLEVIVLPDLSSSLTGHLMKGYTPLSQGGIPLDYLRELSASVYTIAIGLAMEPAAQLLREYLHIPYCLFKSVTGLRETDAFFAFLQQLSRSETQVKYRWQRQFLLDTMLDARSVYRGKRVAVLLEEDQRTSLLQMLAEMGVEPAKLPQGLAAPAEDCRMLEGGDAVADFWIGNSFAQQRAASVGIRYILAGFPVFNRLGTPFTLSVGYRGTAERLRDYGNSLLNAGPAKGSGTEGKHWG